MGNITAQELAERFGHGNSDAHTTIKTVDNPESDSDEAETMDLRVCGAGPEAFFEWITEDGDPIGEMFDEIDEAELVVETQKADVPRVS